MLPFINNMSTRGPCFLVDGLWKAGIGLKKERKNKLLFQNEGSLELLRLEFN